MRLLQSSLVLSISTLIVVLTGRSSIAFTITPSEPGATEFYREVSISKIDNTQQAVTSIDKRIWLEPLSRGGTFIFNSALNLWSIGTATDDWNFVQAQNDLDGSFEIVTDQACGLLDGCGGASTPISDINETYRGIGSLFHLKYNPAPTDPQPGQGNLHWIQVLQASYNTIGIIPVVDNGGRKDTPYYDYPGYRFAGEDFFMDQAYLAGRGNASKPNYFDARLYLAEDTTPPGSKTKTVTIYNGIRWGWSNNIVENPSCPVQLLSSDSQCTPQPKIDLEFLFDTTGSMSSSIGAVQTAAQDILNQLDALGADYRIAVADYKDFPNQDGYPYRADLPFSTDKTAIIDSINSLSGNIGGGGDTPESAYSGLINTIYTNGLGSWRDGVKKAVVIMTDAPPHDPEPYTGYTSKDVVDAAYAVDPAIIYSIIPGGDSTAVSYFSKISEQTGGKLYTTNSSKDIVNALFDITNEVTNPLSGSTGGTPQSVLEPSSIKGLLTLILSGLGMSLLKRKKAEKVTIIN